MQAIKIAELIKDRYPASVVEIKEFHGQVSVIVSKENILETMSYLYESPELYFNYLADLCGVDYLDRKDIRFEVVYNLLSLRHRHFIRIRAQVPEDDCVIDTVSGIWKTALWHERECYDMYGIEFKGHPDLRRILMPEDWDGHPLRKDYPLKSDLGVNEWSGYLDVVRTAQKNTKYDVR